MDAIGLALISAEAQPRRPFGIMYLAEGDTLIDSTGRTFQGQQDALIRTDHREKPVERHVMVKQSTRSGSSDFADKELKQFRCRAVLRRQKRFFPQFTPVNHITRCQRMALGESDDDTFAQQQQRPLAPAWTGLDHKGDVNRGIGEIGDQMVARSVDHTGIDIGEAVLVVEEGGPEIAS